MTQEELKNIAPKLFELQKLNNSFDVPKGYFKLVEKMVSSAILLDCFSNKNSFETPKEYFEIIESSVIEKIENENASIPENYFATIEEKIINNLQKESKVISIKKKRRLLYMGAASVAASIILIFTMQFINSSETNSFLTLEAFEIESWIDNGEIGINNYEIAAIYNDISTDEFDIYSSYDDDDMLDYLYGVNVESFISTN